MGRRGFEVPAGKGDEEGEVGVRGVATAVLPEGEVSPEEGGLDWREGCGAEVLLAKELVDWAGGDFGEEHTLRVGPAIGFNCSGADEDGARSAKGDEFV